MITVLSLTLAALIAVSQPTGPETRVERPTWVERQTYVMGTVLSVRVEARGREEGLAAIEEVFSNTRRLEEMLSSWTSGSEVGEVNGAPAGQPVTISEELRLIVGEAFYWVEETGGAFDPAVGALTDAWELRGSGRKPSDDQLADALTATGIRHFELSPGKASIRRHDDRAWLDTGGFGKGVALRQAEAMLRAGGVSAATLDFGGQLLVFGAPGEPEGWAVGVAHPRLRSEPYAQLSLASGSVSTSAQSERFVTIEGERYGHIIDPRSGSPVPAWGSVTVVAADAVVADVLSTALLVMGVEEGMKWAERRDDVAVLFLEERDGEVRASWNQALEAYQLITDVR